jgi:hypothetical protein
VTVTDYPSHSHSHSFSKPYGTIPISDEMAREYLAKDRQEAAAEMGRQMDKILKEKYLPAIEKQLYDLSGINPLTRGRLPDIIPVKKDPIMETKYLVEDEVAKRKAAKARKKVKKAYKAFDALGLDGNDYAVWAWCHDFKNKAGTVYEYVALYTNERWYVTGSKSVQGVDTDEFVGWLVTTGFDPDNFVELA